MEAKLLIDALRHLLNQGAYRHNQQAFDKLADTIRNEEKDIYYAQHPEEIHVQH